MNARAQQRPPRQRGPYRSLRHAEALTEADRKVLRLLEQQPLRSWPRDVLRKAAGMGDRAMRESISRLATAGIAVISSNGEGGYAIARTADEVRDAKAELISRLRVIASRAQALDQVERLMRDREAAGATVTPRRMALV